MHSYGERIIPVFKANGGQASAVNAGFMVSHGQFVLFLDADDMLHSHIVQQVIESFRRCPDCAVVQYKLHMVDALGTQVGMVLPPAHIRLPNGDLRAHINHIFNNTWWSFMSGNVFAAEVLRQVLPMPEHIFKHSADYYLSRASALCAPVRSLDIVGASYRVHGANNFSNPAAIDPDNLRVRIARLRDANAYLLDLARRSGVKGVPRLAHQIPDVMFFSERLLSLKLDPQRHPIRHDTLLSLSLRGIHATLVRVDVPWRHKLLHIVWFVLMVAAPRALTPWLAAKLFFPTTRGVLNHWLALFLERG
jgi:hypothetical protein